MESRREFLARSVYYVVGASGLVCSTGCGGGDGIVPLGARLTPRSTGDLLASGKALLRAMQILDPRKPLDLEVFDFCALALLACGMQTKKFRGKSIVNWIAQNLPVGSQSGDYARRYFVQRLFGSPNQATQRKAEAVIQAKLTGNYLENALAILGLAGRSKLDLTSRFNQLPSIGMPPGIGDVVAVDSTIFYLIAGTAIGKTPSQLQMASDFVGRAKQSGPSGAYWQYYPGEESSSPVTTTALANCWANDSPADTWLPVQRQPSGLYGSDTVGSLFPSAWAIVALSHLSLVPRK